MEPGAGVFCCERQSCFSLAVLCATRLRSARCIGRLHLLPVGSRTLWPVRRPHGTFALVYVPEHHYLGVNYHDRRRGGGPGGRRGLSVLALVEVARLAKCVLRGLCHGGCRTDKNELDHPVR